jgi:hypothetical protein
MIDLDRPTVNVLACVVLTAMWWVFDAVLWRFFKFDLSGDNT